jgi:hypothetical protein
MKQVGRTFALFLHKTTQINGLKNRLVAMGILSIFLLSCFTSLPTTKAIDVVNINQESGTFAYGTSNADQFSYNTIWTISNSHLKITFVNESNGCFYGCNITDSDTGTEYANYKWLSKVKFNTTKTETLIADSFLMNFTITSTDTSRTLSFWTRWGQIHDLYSWVNITLFNEKRYFLLEQDIEVINSSLNSHFTDFNSYSTGLNIFQLNTSSTNMPIITNAKINSYPFTTPTRNVSLDALMSNSVSADITGEECLLISNQTQGMLLASADGNVDFRYVGRGSTSYLAYGNHQVYAPGDGIQMMVFSDQPYYVSPLIVAFYSGLDPVLTYKQILRNFGLLTASPTFSKILYHPQKAYDNNGNLIAGDNFDSLKARLDNFRKLGIEGIQLGSEAHSIHGSDQWNVALYGDMQTFVDYWHSNGFVVLDHLYFGNANKSWIDASVSLLGWVAKDKLGNAQTVSGIATTLYRMNPVSGWKNYVINEVVNRTETGFDGFFVDWKATFSDYNSSRSGNHQTTQADYTTMFSAVVSSAKDVNPNVTFQGWNPHLNPIYNKNTMPYIPMLMNNISFNHYLGDDGGYYELGPATKYPLKFGYGLWAYDWARIFNDPSDPHLWSFLNCAYDSNDGNNFWWDASISRSGMFIQNITVGAELTAIKYYNLLQNLQIYHQLRDFYIFGSFYGISSNIHAHEYDNALVVNLFNTQNVETIYDMKLVLSDYNLPEAPYTIQEMKYGGDPIAVGTTDTIALSVAVAADSNKVLYIRKTDPLSQTVGTTAEGSMEKIPEKQNPSPLPSTTPNFTQGPKQTNSPTEIPYVEPKFSLEFWIMVSMVCLMTVAAILILRGKK